MKILTDTGLLAFWNKIKQLVLGNRPYNPSEFSGKGYKVLEKNIQTVDGVKKNILTAIMINQPNTIYEIRYDFDLYGETIEMKEGCILKFNGGSLSNGSVLLNKTQIANKENAIIFNHLNLTGSCVEGQILHSSWIYNAGNDITKYLSSLFDISENCTLYIDKEIYTVSASNNADSILNAKSNSNIVINGCINLLPNEFQAYNIVSLKSVENVSLSGLGEINGDLQTHNGTKGEWGHGLSVTSCNNIKITDISINNCWGDCLYIGGDFTDGLSTCVNVHNVKCDNFRRNGISVTGVKRIFLNDLIVKHTSSAATTLPGASLDVEANSDSDNDEVYINNCDFSGVVYLTKDAAQTVFPSNHIFKVSNSKATCFLLSNNVRMSDCDCNYLSIEKTKDCIISNCNVTKHGFVTFGDCENIIFINCYFQSTTRESGYNDVIVASPDVLISNVKFYSCSFDLTNTDGIRLISSKTLNSNNTLTFIKCIIDGGTSNQMTARCGDFYDNFIIVNRIILSGTYLPKQKFVGNTILCDTNAFFVNSNVSDDKVIFILNNKIFSESETPDNILYTYGTKYSINAKVFGNITNQRDKSRYAASRPSLASSLEGIQFYNTTNNKLEIWNGSIWKDCMGESADINRSGVFSDRPTPNKLGFQYFNTDTHKQITWDGSKWWNPDGTEATY